MGKVFTTHGIVRQQNRDRFAHRNLLDEQLFRKYLLSRQDRFVCLTKATRGCGDALTIDDSLAAAGHAALVARRLGHEVTLFVNGFNIENGRPYDFSVLNLVLDNAQASRVSYCGRQFDMAPTAKQRLRKAIKSNLARMASEKQRSEHVETIRDLLNSGPTDLPDYLAPISRTELRELHTAGVRIENHGWTHVAYPCLGVSEIEHEIEKGKGWILSNLSVEANAFAVPFGEAHPPASKKSLVSIWYLLDSRCPDGFLDEHVFNRVSLHLAS